MPRVITDPMILPATPVSDLRTGPFGLGSELDERLQRVNERGEIRGAQFVLLELRRANELVRDDPRFWVAPYRNPRSMILAHRARLYWQQVLNDARAAEQAAREAAARAGTRVERWIGEVAELERFEERGRNALLAGVSLALTWGAAGAAVGTLIVPGLGTLVGGIIGAAIGLILGVVLAILPLERWEFRRRWQTINNGFTRWERFFFAPAIKQLMDKVRVERCSKPALPPLRIATDELYTVYGCVDQLIEWVYEDAWDADMTPPIDSNEQLEAFVLSWCAAHNDDTKQLRETRAWNVAVNEGKGPRAYQRFLRSWGWARCGSIREEASRRGFTTLDSLPLSDERIRQEFIRLAERARGGTR